MTCTHAPRPMLVEEAVMRPPAGPMRSWRCYRIEYGHECGCPEGRLWLPAAVDPQDVERLLLGLVGD